MDAVEAYVRDLFAIEDAALTRIRERHAALGLPEIYVSPEEGKLLHVLLRAVGARRVLEIGSLGGYSGVWLARALPDDGELISIESDPKHATAARNAFEAAGVAKNVTLLEGNAAELLPTLEPPFDAVFVDADKEPMATYFHEAMRLLAPGGLLLGDNGLLEGRVADPADGAADVEGVRAFNRLTASDPRLSATLVPIRDGLVVGVKTRA